MNTHSPRSRAAYGLRSRPAWPAFTLVELLVVIAVIGVLVSILLPSLVIARRWSEQVVCASNLRQIGQALEAYVSHSRGRLPLVIEPLWARPGVPPANIDWTIDPTRRLPSGEPAYPNAFVNVMKPWLSDSRVLICPSALLGYPRANPKVTYRFAAANASNGVVQFYEQFFTPAGDVDYMLSFKYLNYRLHKVEYVTVDMDSGLNVLRRGAGPYPIARDFIAVTGGNVKTAPHYKGFNRLRNDFSVTLDRDNVPVTPHP